MLAGSGHLLFDLNPAEQGFIRVLTPWLDQPLADILADPPRRARFLRDSQAVGNQVHGTLALSAAALHQAARAGAPLGTLTLRRLALAGSTLALGLWLVALGRGATPGGARTRAWLVMGALWGVAPVVLLKLTLVFWGTHEVVVLLHALVVAALAPALDGRSPRPRLALALASAALPVLALANASLALPLGLAVSWLAMLAARDARRPVLVAAAAALTAATCALLTLVVVRQTGWLTGLGQPREVWGDTPLLVGKRGRSFLLSQGVSLSEITLWSTEIAQRGMPLWPSDGYGPAAAWWEPRVRAAVGLVAAGSVGSWLLAGRPRPGARLQAFLGGSLLVGWVAVTALSQTHGLDPGIPGGITPRYYAHLYPVAIALLALWASRRWWAVPVVAGLVFLGVPDHRLLLDERQPASLAAAPVGTCDATAAWLQAHSDRAPAPERLAHGTLPAAHLRGLLLLEAWHFRDYWRWHRPGSATAVDLERVLQRHLQKHAADAADPAFWEGVGRALACVYPPGARDQPRAVLAEQAARYPTAPAIRALAEGPTTP